MSIGREAGTEIEIEDMLQRETMKQLAREKKWLKNGKIIDIDDMDDRYIQNCINWIQKNDETDMFIDHLYLFDKILRKRNSSLSGINHSKPTQIYPFG